MKICEECYHQLMAIEVFVNKAKNLDRLFTGLTEENESDLTVKRLNAYRAHFNLTKMIDDVQAVKNEYYECIEYKEDELEVQEEAVCEVEEVIESIEEIDSMSFNQDDYNIAEEEVYLEEVEMSESYQEPDLQRRISRSRELPTEKTEDEKLFTFQCHICSHPEFLKMKLLSMHCRQIHSSLPQVRCCSEDCGAVLSTWRRLLIHKEKHFPNEERLRCPECLKVYSTLAGLERHLNTHDIQFICGHCGKEFKEAKTLRWHEETHLRSLEDRRNHQCSFPNCGLKFITKQACQNHIAMKHQKIINFYCSEPNCEKTFYTRKHLYEHLRVHGDRKYFCDQCNFKAKTKSALNSHKDVHRTGESYSCDICNASFSVYRRLKAHMICHSDATPFQCEFCESSFKRSKDLKSHIHVHTKE